MVVARYSAGEIARDAKEKPVVAACGIVQVSAMRRAGSSGWPIPSLST